MIHATIRNGNIDFDSERNLNAWKVWKQKHEGVRITILDDDPSSNQQQRFFSGAVVPYFFYQHLPGVYENLKEARNALKLYALPVYMKDETGTIQRSAGSTKDLSKKRFNAFLGRIEAYFDENGYLYPNSAEYNEWEKRGALVGEVFPPLKPLIRSWYRSVGKPVPVQYLDVLDVNDWGEL